MDRAVGLVVGIPTAREAGEVGDQMGAFGEGRGITAGRGSPGRAGLADHEARARERHVTHRRDMPAACVQPDRAPDDEVGYRWLHRQTLGRDGLGRQPGPQAPFGAGLLRQAERRVGAEPQ